MRYFLFLIMVVTLLSCDFFHSRRTPTSEWDMLDRAGPAKCSQWPQTTDILSFDKIWALKGASPSFFASSSLRSGEGMNFFVPFEGSPKISHESLIPVKYGKDDIILGITQLHGGMMAASMQSGAVASQGVIELRSLPNNVVVYNTKPMWDEVSEGYLASGFEGVGAYAVSGYWVALRKGAGGDLKFEEKASETNISFLKLPQKGAELTVQQFKNLSFPSDVVVLPRAKEKSALAVYMDEERLANKKGAKGEAPLVVQELFEDGRHVASKSLGVMVDSNLESWSAIYYDGGLYLAYIDGDSLVGRANLKITKYEWGVDGARQLWTRGFKLDNVHLSDPVWIVRKFKPYLLLLEWLDGEATMSVFPIVPATGVEEPTLQGIYQKGARVEDMFVDPTEDRVYSLIRYKTGDLWSFEVCSLPEF